MVVGKEEEEEEEEEEESCGVLETCRPGSLLFLPSGCTTSRDLPLVQRRPPSKPHTDLRECLSEVFDGHGRGLVTLCVSLKRGLDPGEEPAL